MSKVICGSAIRGAHAAVVRAKAMLAEAIHCRGADHAIGFPDTAYHLPVIYSLLGHKVAKLSDLGSVLDHCEKLLPDPPSDQVWLPYLGDALDAGMATLFAFETIEACKTVVGPNPVDGIWLGAASDVIIRERGVEFVDGTAPGFAAVIGAAPDQATAVRIATQLQEKNLYVFMSGHVNGASFAEQLHSEGVQLGWETRLVPFGKDMSATIYSLGFANRTALSFGGVAPGDYARNLRYNKNRIFAFVLALGEVDEEKYATAAGAINYGFPTIADTDIPQILPTGVCTYEHVVSRVPHEIIVDRALEVRGCKVKVSKVPIPVAYGPAFEGERIRKNECHVEFGGNLSTAFEFVSMVEMDEIEDGRIEIIGPDIDEVPEGSVLPLAVWVEVAGRKMQVDFEPILERQIHHLINGAEGIWHMGQRDIVWTRVSKKAFARGVRLRHYGEILHAKFLDGYPAIVDKVKVTLITDGPEIERRVAIARKVYVERNRRLESMTDESVDTFYSCLLCQSFAPNHVCIITPERLGLCGAYNWLDGKAAHEIDETGPNQPVAKGRCIDPVRGIWENVNEYVHRNSHGAVSCITTYSMMDRPMTSCGCFEAIVGYVPECNGVMVVNREFTGETPVGMTFSTLAGMVGGGVQTPGFLGVGKAFLSSRKFLAADGGLPRVAWMTTGLKRAVGEDMAKRAAEIGHADLLDRIADETVATDPHAIREHMEKVGHPALHLPDMASLWTTPIEPTDAETEAGAPRASAVEPSRPAESVTDSGGTAGSPRQSAEVSGMTGVGGPASGASARDVVVAGGASATTTTGIDKTALVKELKAALKQEVVQEVVTEIIAALHGQVGAAELIHVLRERFRGPGRAVDAVAPGAMARPDAPATAGMASQPAVPGEAADTARPAVSAEPRVGPLGGHAELQAPPVGRPARYAAEKFAAITAFGLPRTKAVETIEQVTIGATPADGGTRRRTVTVGGQDCLPFHYFEGVFPHPPVLALEVFDAVGERCSPVLRAAWGEYLDRPVEMARKAVEEFGAELVSVRLEGTHPEKGDRSPGDALALVKDVLAAVDVPVIVTGHGHFASVNEAFKKVAAGCAGERLLLNWVEAENYRTIAGVALAYGHCVVARSPIDVNLAKQLNILLGNMDVPRERIVMDPLTGALGYGLEYTYSVMERIRLTGLGGDRALAFPMIVCAGQEAWKVKETSAAQSAFPAWGELNRRAVMWEVQTAMPLVLAGADIVVLHHPESLAALRRSLARLTCHERITDGRHERRPSER